MRILIFLIIVFVIFGLPVLLFVKLAKNKFMEQKKSSWEGKLVDKEHLELEEDNSPYTKDIYTLYFETNDGKKVKVNVSKNVYEQWEIGNQAKKEISQLLPQKIA